MLNKATQSLEEGSTYMDNIKKGLFAASFEESRRISPNLISNKPFSYSLGLSESRNGFKRLFMLIPAIMLIILLCGPGVFLPEYLMKNPTSETRYMTNGIFYGISYFRFLKPIIIFLIITFFSIAVINIFPKRNYMVQRIFGVVLLLNLLLLFIFSMMPMLLGITLGAAGWLGFILINVYGLTFMFIKLNKRKQNLKKELYMVDEYHEITQVTAVWEIMKKFFWVPLILILVNIAIFRIGMISKFSIWSFVWLFLGIVYYLMITGFLYGTMKMFVSSYYFAKYSRSYKEIWKVTDEQWYGKRRAKRIKRKNKKMKQKEETKIRKKR